MPRVSVVVPTYNQEQFIQSTLTSVLNQTYQDFEIVIANDASTDNTVTKIQAVHDPRIRLFSLERNQGESAATNYGIQQAQGKYIAILHSDDLFRPDKLERQVNFLEQNPQFDAVLSHAEVIDEAGRPLPDKTHVLQQIFPQPNRTRFQWLNQFFIRDNCLCQTSSMVRCSCYQTVGLYDRRLRQIPDFDFWVRFCLQHELHIIPEPLTQYRVHQSNISGIRPETIKRHHIEVLQILKHFLCEEVYQHIFEIFPYLYQQYGSGFESDLAPFLLAQQAFIVNRSPHQLFGLEILYQLLNQPDVVERLNQKYNFDFYDLIELTGKYDIFGFDQQSRSKANSTHISRGSLSTGNRSEKRLKLANLPGKIGQNPPLVSIVIPTYNGEQFISETLQTALQQTYTNLEIIVSDDGSVDQTLDIVHSFQQQCNWPCSVLTHKNYGLVGNLNFCIQQARGKYIKFLFQDDLLEPDCIAEMVA
ncbi:MAG: glycosyltransferase [Microcoleaceae cyanobacterium]